MREDYAGKTLDALRWLESLPPPDIIASRLADDRGHRRALNVAMPHNSPAKNDFARYHPDLAPVLRATPEHDDHLLAAYRWTEESPDFASNAELYLPALREAAAKLGYMGRAEDRVECEVYWHTEEAREPVNDSFEVWYPSSQAEDATLLTARPRSTDELMADFRKASERRAREAKNPSRLFLREQGYSRNAAEGLLPVHTAIFQIYEGDNPDPLVCDAPNAHRWRSPLRALACEIGVQHSRWNDSALAEELISGHLKGGGHTQQPHLAFVPLPSVSMAGKADGRVRRFALLGYASPGKASAAKSIYRTLAASLDGEEVEAGCRLELIQDERRDKVWALYARASESWVTITPLAIARGFKVAKHAPGGHPLSNDERHHRRNAEWSKLVRASLLHVGLPPNLVGSCVIHLTPSPLHRSAERAERYRPKGESAPFMHAKLEFSRPVRGPLLLGDRRYFGLGLFVPVSPAEGAAPLPAHPL
jgi:CRISPR-associated protein Csb2